MNRALAVVRSVDGGEAVVEIATTGCGRCDQPGGCGRSAGALSDACSRRFRVANDAGARVGECVEVSIGDGVVARSASIAYIGPLAGVLLGAGVGHFVFGTAFGETGTISASMVGLLSGGWLAAHIGRRSLSSVRPEIVKRPSR